MGGKMHGVELFRSGRKLWVWLGCGLHLGGRWNQAYSGEEVSTSRFVTAGVSTGSITLSLTCKQSQKQATQSAISLPGYALQLSPDIADSALPPLLEGVGLQRHYCPSHLELLQAVDVAAFPRYWLSPLHCKLYPQQSIIRIIVGCFL